MGILERVSTKNRISLAARSVLGRSGACVVRVEDPHVSGEHASVFWSGSQWEVKDLGSSNGTSVDGKKLVAGEPVPLREGSELSLAGDVWVLASALPPTASARSESGQVRVAEEGLLVLPDGSSPLASAYEDGAGVWRIEVGDESRVAVDQETIVAGEPWVLSIPPISASPVPRTEKLGHITTLSSVTVRIGVSTNEEHVELTVVYEDRPPKRSSRAFHHVLLTLARERLRDRDLGRPAPDQGWIYMDAFLRMVGMEPEPLNVAICRARKELASHFGIADAGMVIERRPASRQIRLGTDKVEIVKV